MPIKKPIIPKIASFIFCFPLHSSGSIPPQAINKNSPLNNENKNESILCFILIYFKHNTAVKNTIQCSKNVAKVQ